MNCNVIVIALSGKLHSLALASMCCRLTKLAKAISFRIIPGRTLGSAPEPEPLDTYEVMGIL